MAGDKAFDWHTAFLTVFEPKEKEAFHIVLTTHNSRTSQRMMEMGIEKGEPVNLSLKEEIELTKIIGQVVQEEDYDCIAYNVCKDHRYLVLVCEYAYLTNSVQKLKSTSSRLISSLGSSNGTSVRTSRSIGTKNNFINTTNR